MSNQTVLKITDRLKSELWEHLIGNEPESENAAFLFVNEEILGKEIIYNVIDWYPVPEHGFFFKSDYHIELSDETIAKSIKKSHDLKTCLVEVHSHLGQKNVRFSASDFWGFKEFVPHVLWRLKDRPYLAVVISTEGGFDGLVWKSANEPVQLDNILTETEILNASCNSLLKIGDLDYE